MGSLGRESSFGGTNKCGNKCENWPITVEIRVKLTVMGRHKCETHTYGPFSHTYFHNCFFSDVEISVRNGHPPGRHRCTIFADFTSTCPPSLQYERDSRRESASLLPPFVLPSAPFPFLLRLLALRMDVPTAIPELALPRAGQMLQISKVFSWSLLYMYRKRHL